ncbi:MAG: sulfatase activating formylglycine-generating enzyme [Myxococcota bacterium]
MDHRTDIFSLGVVMYEMLALRRPFQGDTTHQVAQQIVLGDPPDMRVVRSKIPQDLAVICAKALEKNPERRYEAMAELAADIERHLSNEPIHAQPPTRVDRAIKWAKRNPTKSVAAVLVAVSLVVVSGLGLRITKQRDDLSAQTEELTAANTALGAKTEEAERRARDGLRLSLSQTYEDLVSDAEDLWPPHPAKIAALAAWVSDARALTGEFESRAVIAERDEWRKLALPQSQEERQADRESHPGFVELERGRGELVFRRRALAQRKDGHEAELPSVDWSMAPGDAARLGARARVLVDGERASFGNETFGLVLAERAIKLASDRERSEIAETLSQAYFALGRDDEALMMAHLAVDETTDRDRTAREAALARLETAVEEKCSSTGLAAEAERIKQLEQRVSDLEVGVGERRTWKFPEEMYEKTMARWLHGQLSELIAKLELLNSPGAGLFTENGVSHEHGWSVVRRLAFAERLKAEFDPGGEYALRWEEAQPEINAAYPGLSLAPQMGLVPMGADSESGLWEFWHVASGERPEGEPGQYFIVESTGIVLVLLPRGTFSRGAQMNAGGMNPDPHADSDESPVRRIQLEPFFISKYEMTQAQWERITAGNPSDFGPGGERSWRSREGHPIDGCHPVEQTTWAECRRVLGRLGLALPTETQWEYAARGATSTPWWTGAQKESVSEAANLKDSYMRRMGGSATRPFEEWLDDGYTMHAPVDAFLPNGFGLHNVIGNVWEWCDGAYAPYGPSTGVQSPVRGDDVRRLLRGGAFNSTVIQARSANRMGVAPGTATNSSGVRPARLITD